MAGTPWKSQNVSIWGLELLVFIILYSFQYELRTWAFSNTV